MIEASLTVTMPDNWVKDILKKYPTPIKFLDCMPYGSSGGRGLIEIDGETAVAEEMIEDIQSHPNVCKMDISRFGDGKISGAIITNKCAACEALTGSECFLTKARGTTDGKVRWKIITGSNSRLGNLIDRLKEFDCEVEINSITKIHDQEVVTRRQKEIINVALEKGYYDYPRGTTIRDLAKVFDISPSTLGEILQRGERNIIKSFFGKE